MMNSGKFHRSFITRKKLGWALAVLGFGLPIVGHGTDDSATGIAYPEGFRKWTHITTMVVGASSPFFQTSGGIHHVYANERAMQGYAAGKFPDGSVLVFDLHDAKEKDGVTSEGPRQRIDVMVKDSAHFAATGG